jgi:hypothetical protein
MSEATIKTANPTLDAWTTAANCETQLRASQIAWNEHVMSLVEKRVKIERDTAEVQAMQSALVGYHRATQELEHERRQLARRADQVSRSVAHGIWVLMGETINPDNVNDVWISLRYLVGQSDLDGASTLINAIECGKRAANLSGWLHVRSHETAIEPHPGSNIRSAINWASRFSYMPRLGSPAMKPFEELIAVLQSVASCRLAKLKAQADGLAHELLELRKESWNSINYGNPPKGVAS